MRFRIRKSNDGSTYTIVASGEMDDDAGWDLLEIAQTMLNIPLCKELILDLRPALIVENLSMFNTDTLVSLFEEGLMRKDCALVIQYHGDNEARFCSDQLKLEPATPFTNVSINEAKFFSRAMNWLALEARFLVN